MRFAAANKQSSGNWIQAGKAASKASADIFATATAYGPDFGGMAQAWQDSQSRQKINAMKAQADVVEKGIDTTKQVEVASQKRKGTKARQDAERKTKFAGKLAAVGGIVAKGLQKKEPPLPPAQVDVEAVRELENRIYGDTPDPAKPDEPTEVKPAETADTPPATQAPPTADIPEQNPPAQPGQALTKQQLRVYGRNAGFPEEELDTFVAVAMAESGGKIDAYNGKGDDDSYGIMQINMLDRPGYRMGEERRSQWNLNSNDELFDPQKNANAAFSVWQSQGWKGWGAFNNGSYTQFL